MLKILLFLFFPLIILFHDFHVSHTTLHYNNDLDIIEITIKVPIEDLEKRLEKKKSNKLRIGTKNESQFVKEKIINYINKNFKVYLNNKIYNYQWIGKELDNNLHDIYLYFEIPNCTQNEKIQSITLSNTIFLEDNLNQTNIVLIEFNENNFNLTFSKDHENQKISIIL